MQKDLASQTQRFPLPTLEGFLHKWNITWKSQQLESFSLVSKRLPATHIKWLSLISPCKQYYSAPLKQALVFHFRNVFNRMLPLYPPSSQLIYQEHVDIIRSTFILHLWTTMSYSNVVWLLLNLNKISFPFCPQANCEILIHMKTHTVDSWLSLGDSSNSQTQNRADWAQTFGCKAKQVWPLLPQQLGSRSYPCVLHITSQAESAKARCCTSPSKLSWNHMKPQELISQVPSTSLQPLRICWLAVPKLIHPVACAAGLGTSALCQKQIYTGVWCICAQKWSWKWLRPSVLVTL